MVGRSLPLTLLSVWEKYRERGVQTIARRDSGIATGRSGRFEKQD